MQPLRLKGPNQVEDAVKQGDTWPGFTIKGSAGGDDPTELLPNLVSARLQFRDRNKRFVYELSSDQGSEYGLPKDWPNNEKGNITIVDPVLWVIGVDSQPLPMQAGSYTWELETTDAMNVIRTLLKGKMRICQDGVI